MFANPLIQIFYSAHIPGNIIAHFGKNYLDEAQIWGIEHPDDSWDNESAFQLVEEGAVLPF